jgi:hypothetical protein
MRLFNLFKKKNNNSNNIDTPIENNIQEEINTDKIILDKEKYYESKIRIYCQMAKNNLNEYKLKTTLDECFTKLINLCEDSNYIIKNKEELINILNLFYKENNDLIDTKDTILNYIENEFNFKVLSIEEINERKETENKLKNLRTIIFNNYKAIKMNDINKDFAWMVFCYKNNLNKNELINNLKISLTENNINEDEINNEINSLNIILSFGNVPTLEEVEAYRYSIGYDKEETIEEAYNFFKKKIENNDNKIYIKLYSTFYWSRYSYKYDKSKDEILSILNNKDIDLIKESLNNFDNICSKEELDKAQEKLERYVLILDLKKYINNWKQVKTNQINESDIEDKNRYFKELEEDYLNLTNSLNDKLEVIDEIINKINSRDYINKLNINSTKVMQSINIESTDNNSIENELNSIKRWQETISNLRKY